MLKTLITQRPLHRFPSFKPRLKEVNPPRHPNAKTAIRAYDTTPRTMTTSSGHTHTHPPKRRRCAALLWQHYICKRNHLASVGGGFVAFTPSRGPPTATSSSRLHRKWAILGALLLKGGGLNRRTQRVVLSCGRFTMVFRFNEPAATRNKTGSCEGTSQQVERIKSLILCADAKSGPGQGWCCRMRHACTFK